MKIQPFKRLSKLRDDIYMLYDVFSNFALLTGDFCESGTIVIRDKLIYDLSDSEFPWVGYVDKRGNLSLVIPYLTHEGNILLTVGLCGLGWRAWVGNFIDDAPYYYRNLLNVLHPY